MKLSDQGISKNIPGEWFLIFVYTALGAVLRIFLIQRADFPLNDGGLFFSMIKDLQASNFALPKYASYNALHIPFAYPPLPFYLAGALENFFKIDALILLRCLPVLFSILTIPAFYLLGRELLQSRPQAMYATLAFAFVPAGLEWLIMGGGLTRSPAFFFSLLALHQAIRALKTRQKKNLWLAALFTALTGYCHLEILWITVIYIAIAAWFFSRNLRGLTALLVIYGGAFLLMSPYIFSVLANHGLQPFISAMQSGKYSLGNSFGKLLLSNMTGEFLFTPVLVLALFGLARCLLDRDYLLVTWLLGATIFNSRSIERSAIVVICLLAGIGLGKVILPNLSFSNTSPSNEAPKTYHSSTMLFPNLISAILISYIFLRSAISGSLFLLGEDSMLQALSQPDRAAMQWAAENTAPGSRFLVLTAPVNWSTNKRAEWFPALAQRASLSTVQGTEWLPGQRFTKQEKLHQQLNECLLKGLSCIDDIARSEVLTFTHIYIAGDLQTNDQTAACNSPLQADLIASPEYELVYAQENILIFAKAP